MPLSHGPFERDGEKFLCFDSKFHWQLIEHFFGIAVYY